MARAIQGIESRSSKTLHLQLGCVCPPVGYDKSGSGGPEVCIDQKEWMRTALYSISISACKRYMEVWYRLARLTTHAAIDNAEGIICCTGELRVGGGRESRYITLLETGFVGLGRASTTTSPFRRTESTGRRSVAPRAGPGKGTTLFQIDHQGL